MGKKKVHLFDVINVVVLVLLCAVIIVPIVFVINQSLMSNEDILKYGFTLIPKSINWDAYEYLLIKNSALLRSCLVSIGVTLFGTAANLIVTSMYAYGLSKKDLPFRGILTFAIFITMIFNGGLIPKYLLVTSLGLKNSYLALVLPILMVAWNTLILRNFFQAIPDGLLEAARLDGADEIQLFTKVVLPLSKSAIATVGLFYAVKHLQIATFCGQQGRISRTVRAILSGQFEGTAGLGYPGPANQY